MNATPQIVPITRIQIDGWRLIYEVDDSDRTITVIRIVRRDANTYV